MRLSYRDIILGIILFLLPFILPVFTFSEVNTLVATASTLFAIVAGFFIADAMSNYLRLQTLIAEENGALMAIADYTKKLDPSHTKTVNEAIDAYMIAQLDLGTLGHILDTREHVDKLNASLSTLDVKNDSTLYDHILNATEVIRTTRQEISLAAKNNLGPGHWVTLILLELIVVSAVLSIRDGEFLINLVVSAIIFCTYSVLILLREIDNNHLLERKLAFENPRDVFHAIGKPPYYPSHAPKSTRIPDENNEMRIGI